MITKEQVLMLEHSLIDEATEWGDRQGQNFYEYVSGVEAMTGKVLEVLNDGKADIDGIH